MAKIRTRLILFLGVFPLLFALYSHTGHCLTLMTSEEAAQPDAPVPRGVKLATIQENGPQVKIYSPHANEDSFLNLRPYKDETLHATEARGMIIAMIFMSTWPGAIG